MEIRSVDEGTAGIGPTTTERVDLNQATQADLDVVPGIGPVLAQRILAYRDEHGPFVRIEDVTHIQGIGPVSFQRFAGRLTVSSPEAEPAPEMPVIAELAPQLSSEDVADVVAQPIAELAPPIDEAPAAGDQSLEEPHTMPAPDALMSPFSEDVGVLPGEARSEADSTPMPDALPPPFPESVAIVAADAHSEAEPDILPPPFPESIAATSEPFVEPEPLPEPAAAPPEPEPPAATVAPPTPPAQQRPPRRLDWLWGALLGGLLGAVFGMLFSLLVLYGINGALRVENSPAFVDLRGETEALGTRLSSAETTLQQLGQKVKTLEDLPARVEGVEADLAALQTEMRTLRGDLATLEGAVETVSEELTTLQRAFAAVEEQMATTLEFFQRLRTLLEQMFGDTDGSNAAPSSSRATIRWEAHI